MRKIIIVLLCLTSVAVSFIGGGFVGITLYADLNRKEIPQYSYALYKELKDNNYEFIDFAALGNNKWNRVCFLGPYNISSSELLGFEWDIQEFTNVLSSDSHNVIIFATDTEVIDFSVNLRSNGDFWEMSGKCVERNKATLVKNKSSTSYLSP